MGVRLGHTAAGVALDAMKGMLELAHYVRGTVDPTLFDLIKRRVAGTLSSAAKLTERERIAMALVDAVGNIGTQGVPDALWREGLRHWSERELADIVTAIIAVHAESRIGTSLWPDSRTEH